MTTFPKITIITPTFNQGKFIEKSILSVLNQGYPNLEYIIIDGGSSDETVSIINKYDHKLTYWISEKDKGQSDAINKGINIATGDIINWLNSDDYLENDVLFKIANDFSEAEVEVVCGYSTLIVSNVAIKKRTSQISDNYAEFISSGHIMQPSTFFRKSIFDQYTPIDVRLHFMMDHYIWLQYVCQYGVEKIKYVDYCMAVVILHDDAKSFKSINLFIDDQVAIYSSLFRSLQLRWINPFEKPKFQLTFNVVSNSIKSSFTEINFNVLVDNLFSKDAHGKRGKLNLKCCYFLVVYFPKYFFAYILKKII